LLRLRGGCNGGPPLCSDRLDPSAARRGRAAYSGGGHYTYRPSRSTPLRSTPNPWSVRSRWSRESIRGERQKISVFRLCHIFLEVSYESQAVHSRGDRLAWARIIAKGKRLIRVLFSTIPVFGHFTSLVPLGHALVAAGHQIAVAAPKEFGEVVDRAGFQLLPAGIGRDEAHQRARERGLDFDDQEALGRRVIPDLFIGQYAAAMAWKPDVLIREEGEFAGPLIGAIAGVPWVDHGWGPLRPRALVEMATEALRPLWRAFGQEPHATGGAYEWLYLDPCPPALQLPHAAAVPVLHRIQPVSPLATTGAVLPAWLGRLEGRRAVYVTLGTVPSFASDPSFFAAAIEALRHDDLEVVITVGPLGDPDEIGPQPPHIHVERFVPQAAVLPHCAAAVTNGGSGATLGALAAGVPVLSVPSTGAPSQIRNAEAVAHHGAGRMLARTDVSAARLRAEIRTLLDDSSYRKNARQIASEIRAMPTPQSVVALVERLAIERRPLLRSK